jgi:hypothetical protein
VPLLCMCNLAPCSSGVNQNIYGLKIHHPRG